MEYLSMSAFVSNEESRKLRSYQPVPESLLPLFMEDGELIGGDRFDVINGRVWLAMDGMDEEGEKWFLDYFKKVASENPDLQVMVVGEHDDESGDYTIEFNQGFSEKETKGLFDVS